MAACCERFCQTEPFEQGQGSTRQALAYPAARQGLPIKNDHRVSWRQGNRSRASGNTSPYYQHVRVGFCHLGKFI